jgi:hypothetical protein
MKRKFTLVLVLLTGAGIGCVLGLTREEAKTSLEEIVFVTQAATLISSSIELHGDFTIGNLVTAAAEELRDFVESQLPCAEVTLENSTLTVVYGAYEGNCTFRGHTFDGTHRVTVVRNQMDDVEVHHEWEQFSNGKIVVDGTADVTWSFSNATRHIVHELAWERLSDGRAAVGSGDRLQGVLDGSLAVGFTEDGVHRWSGESGDWELTIDGAELRWIDPAPQAGLYTLDTPFNKSITLQYERVSSTKIVATVEGGSDSYTFEIATLP